MRGAKDPLAGKFFVQRVPLLLGQVRDRVSPDLYLCCLFGETVAESRVELTRLDMMAQLWVFFDTKRQAVAEWKRRK